VRLVLIIFLFLPFIGFSQQKRIPFSLRAATTVPHPSSNSGLKKSFVGVFDFKVSADIGLIGGFFFGGVYDLSKLKTNPTRVPDLHTVFSSQSAGVRVGYDNFLSEQVLFNVAVSSGYSWINYKKVLCAEAPHYKAGFINPEVNFYFKADDNFYIGGNLGLNFLEYTFDPSSVCFDQKKQFLPEDRTGKSRIFTTGLSMIYTFIKKAE